MMARMDQQRQLQLEPKRMESCKEKLMSLGFNVVQVDSNLLEIDFKGNKIQFYPYSGWHSGKGIQPGRGFSNLLIKLK